MKLLSKGIDRGNMRKPWYCDWLILYASCGECKCVSNVSCRAKYNTPI